MPETHLSVSTDEEIAGLKIVYRIFSVYCCARTLSVRMQRRLQIEIACGIVKVQVVQTPRSCKIREACVESSKFLLKAP
jgi:hypothetical protein